MATSKPPRILLVDDHEQLRQLLRSLFEQAKFTVTEAADGQAGIDAARADAPDVIVMDFYMPQKTGIEAVQELRSDARFARTPIIALTANADAPEELMRRGFTRVFAKPVRFAVLLQAVQEELAGSQR